MDMQIQLLSLLKAFDKLAPEPARRAAPQSRTPAPKPYQNQFA
ncbi:hypothetical protein K788_0004138 [Paraburkholderia caribensis MBA4]|uniref:Uncharacterized protein n=1 Tax=Paraburkholderia caribensis MBA4 TaxID=1323664 RepID=A0A0P0R699_9BURK|nr:hypothetical protein K788_0004138 [Paraburkholderia caribensis MBA4]